MKVLIANEKGGTGKSTLAVNLAAARAADGHDVLLLDTDPQLSVSAWVTIRNRLEVKPSIQLVQLCGGDTRGTILDLASRYEDIIIDTGGRDSAEVRSALLAVDLVITPVQSSQFDLWTLDTMEGLIKTARSFHPELRAMAVLTRGNTNLLVRQVQQAKNYLADFPEYQLADTVIRDRVSWQNSLIKGKSVLEHKPIDHKARTELYFLTEEVFQAEED